MVYITDTFSLSSLAGKNVPKFKIKSIEIDDVPGIISESAGGYGSLVISIDNPIVRRSVVEFLDIIDDEDDGYPYGRMDSGDTMIVLEFNHKSPPKDVRSLSCFKIKFKWEM